MPGTLGALTILLMMGMVLVRVIILRRKGVEAMNFGKIDRTDFLIPPFALFYFFLVFAAAFHLPSVSRQVFFHSTAIPWLGVCFCAVGLALLAWSLVSFGWSFRVGIDAEHPGILVTSGAFAFSRNPIYVAFATILLGQLLIFPNWIMLIYTVAAAWLFHRQVTREEDFLKVRYGEEFSQYCCRVRRYL
jgi:protein-S-isoprenylcysteine O-methyltransferase Ste14